MKVMMYSVYDEKACAYATPFFMSTDGQAIRAFGDAVMEGKSQLAVHPEDFGLYYVGEYDDKTGQVISVVPKFLCRGSEFKNKGVISNENSINS